MKHLTKLTLALLAATFLLTGCVAVVGNRDARAGGGTVGQQLVDLKKAKDAGAMSDAEYEAEKARLLQNQK